MAPWRRAAADVGEMLLDKQKATETTLMTIEHKQKCEGPNAKQKRTRPDRPHGHGQQNARKVRRFALA
jgi:hypothetical protein